MHKMTLIGIAVFVVAIVAALPFLTSLLTMDGLEIMFRSEKASMKASMYAFNFQAHPNADGVNLLKNS